MLDCYDSFSPELGNLARRFFDERWIDAPVRPGKRGGAFCASAVPSAHPYVMLNYTARRRDVLTMAHELGHGVHFALAARQGIFHQGTPLTARRDGVGVRRDDRVRPADRCRPDARVAPGAARREHRGRDRDGVPPGGDEPLRGARAHPAPRGGRAVGRALRRAVDRQPGGAVRRLGRGHRGLPHRGGPTSRTSSTRRATCTRTPTASCSRCRCTERYLERGPAFVPAVPRAARRRAARAAPRSSAAIVDIDLSDPGFWDAGLDLVEGQLAAAEAAAEASGRLESA